MIRTCKWCHKQIQPTEQKDPPSLEWELVSDSRGWGECLWHHSCMNGPFLAQANEWHEPMDELSELVMQSEVC